VITGRHRLDLARRTGEETIPAQVVREDDGFTPSMALTYDAESNIRDGNGTVDDYATYFRHAEVDEATARAHGLLDRAKGRAGWDLGKNAGDDLCAAWRAGKVGEDRALAIARAAPGNPDLQALGIRQALKGAGAAEISNFMQAVGLRTGSQAEQLDMFGRDDAAMREAERMAAAAAAAQRGIQEQIRAVQGPAKRPEAAAGLGVKVQDPEGLRTRIAQLKAEAGRWNNWALHPDLVEQVRGGGGRETAGPGAEPAARVDRIEAALNRLIEATDPLRTAREGELQGGLALPVWATKTIANGALKVVRAAYRAGKSIAEAIGDAVQWLRDQKLEGFQEAEARTWLLDVARGAREPYHDLRDRQAEITQRLGEIRERERRLPAGTGLSDELKGERYTLAHEWLGLLRRLWQDPGYVADLIRRMDGLGQDIVRARQAGNGLHAQQAEEELHGLMGEYERAPVALSSRIYNQLLANGEIVGTESGKLAEGRTLGGLTAWLAARKLDSPKLSLAERLGLARRLSEEWSRGKDALTVAGNRVSAVWQAFKDQWTAPPVDTPFRSLVKDWLFQKKWTGLETHQWVQEIRKQVQSKLRRQAIAVWLDAGGNEDLLRSQAMFGLPDRFKAVWRTALNLTDEEKQLGRQIERDFQEKLEDGLNMGLLKRGREDYGVPQLWKLPPKSDQAYDPGGLKGPKATARSPGARLDPRDPFFALERKSPSYFDGIMHGGIPEDLDVGNLVGRYNAEFHDAAADRGVIKSLKDAAAADGRPVTMISGGARIEAGAEGARTFFVDSKWRPQEAVTADGRPYRVINHWALRDWKFASQDAQGNPIIVHGDFLVHPDHYEFLKNELMGSDLRNQETNAGKVGSAALKGAAWLKASKFASATFHWATLAEHSMFHAFAGQPSEARASLLWPSTRGVELNPLKDARLAGLMRHGMELGFGGQRELFEEGFGSHGGLWSHVPGLGEAMARMTDFVMGDYLPRIKAKTAAVVLDSNLERYRGKLSEDRIYELTARQMNAAFGGQDWRLMGTNKTLLDLVRLGVVTPDFTLSRSKVIGQAFKPYNAEQRYFLLAQAVGVYTAARVLNYLFNSDPHWEPGLADSVVYGGRAWKARFLVSDTANFVQDPFGFASGRLGPFARSGIEATTQRDMRTGVRVDVPFETRNRALRSLEILAKDLAQWAVPVGTEALLPGAAGREQTKVGQAAMALVGVGSRRYTAETEMWDAARRFNQSSTDPRVQLQQQRQEAEVHAASPYRKLDSLLDAGDSAGAARELRAMTEEGYALQSVLRRYQSVGRPFTGNRQRESEFLASLSPAQAQVYARAMAERQTRLERVLRLPQVSAAQGPVASQAMAPQ